MGHERGGQLGAMGKMLGNRIALFAPSEGLCACITSIHFFYKKNMDLWWEVSWLSAGGVRTFCHR